MTLAGAKSTYSALGYVKPYNSAYSYGRIFLGTSSNVSKTDYSNANYTKAMNEHFVTLCNNVKAANIIVMTIALDPRFQQHRRGGADGSLENLRIGSAFPQGSDRPEQAGEAVLELYRRNALDDFKAIGNELSNLRIVS
ncbi:hypothetical protein ACVOMV_33840 [Mesorhizobium atlanticum]